MILAKSLSVCVCGANVASDRSLDIPGEDLTGVHSARTFVNWCVFVCFVYSFVSCNSQGEYLT